jgi:hypothetical protein
MTSLAAMHVHSAQPATPQIFLGRRQVSPYEHPNATRVALAVESIGYLVPRTDFKGLVHSIFAQACNLACNDTLLTLCAFSAGDGPATLRLARGAPDDLRDLFDVGEPVHCRQGCVRTGRAELRLLHASLWRPAGPGLLLPPSRIEAHLCNADLRLAQRRRTHTSVIDGQGAPVVAALRDACRALDSEQAARHVDSLIGWGEGLTPAGDDFLVGLIAGLDAFVHLDERRHRFRGVLAAALTCRTHRTTPIAAHYLRLAAGGHYTEPLLRLRNALLCEDDGAVVDAALQSALAVGATSGADTVSGLLAGLLAWPVAAPAEAARS